MATVNLGSIKFKWKGTYSGATAYTVDDVVEYNGSSYICILASTGNLPTNATYFEQMSQKGTDADLLSIASTAQGDIYYNNGGAIARLGAGTSGQALLTGGSGANPSWGDVGGGLVQTVSAITATISNTTSTSFVDTGLLVNITPSSSSNKIILISHFGAEASTGASVHFDIKRTIGATATQISGDIDGLMRIQNVGNQNAVALTFKDSPNTTSQIEYVISIKSSNGNTVYFNNAGAMSSLIAMEVSV
jgi:hypothetical protein